LARSKGDLLQARHRLQVAGQLAQESSSGYEQGLWQLEAGRLALAEGNAPETITHLIEAVRRFEDGGQRVEVARAYLYLAVAHQLKGDSATALTHLEHAFRLASDLESLHTLIVASREAKTLLVAARGVPATSYLASQLLQQVIQFERDIPALRRRLRRQASAIPLAPPSLTFQALGSVQVWVDGRQVTGADWQAQVARDLLFCLLAHPDGLTREAIGVTFWPESSPAQLKLQFKKTVYRLRRALGQEVVLLDQDRYRFNRAVDYEYDLDMFMEKLAQAQAATDPNAQTAAYRAAVDLYKGHYLPDVDGVWVYPERERLWQTYVEAVLMLAELHLKAGEYGMALDYCQRVLIKDSCLEEAHRLAMRAHAAMGNRAGITRQFESCRHAVAEEVDAPLSRQTEALFASLMH